MYQLIPPNSFKKGLKKYKYDQKALKNIKQVLALLQKGSKLPHKNKEHSLKGRYDNFLECHIMPDLLLIYRRFEDKKLIVLQDIGSHSYLFG